MNKVIIVALLMCLLLTTTTEGFGRRYLVRKVEKSVEANHQSLDESMFVDGSPRRFYDMKIRTSTFQLQESHLRSCKFYSMCFK
ncbi:unnamed protein product [Clavelina lepadiformis]|uniref:Uncharacterized protein n=1 Tax=Clavelina lepadiformis TaxID=159417 RepID=A0ABP0FGQ0_CLALP